ncbi:NAD-dependent epimerase/dehydratase family protein [Desulfosarcina sp. OttesenSCG-928-A07]|nr:NAD-dependent epimerase/dehydratase family protein [Desulfosarcina sp. OttesenSCG-928-A07]
MTDSGKNILVTGGGGFLGSAIVRKLLDQGHRVSSFSRSRHPHLDDWDVEQLVGDVLDAVTVATAIKGRDAVFHVAAKTGVWGDEQEYTGVNVTGTHNVIAGCQFGGVPLLIHTSSPSVVFNGTDMAGVDESVPYPSLYTAPYPKTKAVAERAVRKAASPRLLTLSLRPHLIWGPGDNHLVPRIIKKAKKLRQVGDGTNQVDTTYIDNAALAHVQAMVALEKSPELSGRVYFISDDAPVRLWDMINRILEAAGKPPVERQMTPKTACLIGDIAEWVYRRFNIRHEPPMTRFVAQELSTSHWFNISAAKQDLGYRPEVSIDQGMARLASWLQDSHA